MPTAYCRIGYGLGGQATSPGIDQLRDKIKAKYPDIDVPPPFSGNDEGQVVKDIMAQPKEVPIIIGGYSWDADNTSLIARAVFPRTIAYLFAIQPSVYYPTVPIEDNVGEALCVYNPEWISTFGLGFQQLKLAPGNKKTKFALVATQDTHPAVQFDTKYHDMILASIGRVLGH